MKANTFKRSAWSVYICLPLFLFFHIKAAAHLLTASYRTFLFCFLFRRSAWSVIHEWTWFMSLHVLYGVKYIDLVSIAHSSDQHNQGRNAQLYIPVRGQRRLFQAGRGVLGRLRQRWVPHLGACYLAFLDMLHPRPVGELCMILNFEYNDRRKKIIPMKLNFEYNDRRNKMILNWTECSGAPPFRVIILLIFITCELHWGTYIYLSGCFHHTFCMPRNYFANYFDFKNFSLYITCGASANKCK